jgi:hypothetical protein
MEASTVPLIRASSPSPMSVRRVNRSEDSPSGFGSGSVSLVVSYLRLVVGLRFAAVEAGLAQVCYLVLFSYAFFLDGYTGLVVTIGAIVTLFATMQLTGRIRWSEKFAESGVGRIG